MKASKILAGMSAMALAASMLSALPVSAANPKYDGEAEIPYIEDAGVFTIYSSEMEGEGEDATPVKDDDGNYIPAEGTYYATAKDASFVCGVKYTIVADDETEEVIQSMLDGGDAWIGGGFGFQAKNGDAEYDKTNNWVSFGEWSIVEGVKPYNLVPVEGEANTYTLEYKGDAPLFDKGDYLCNLWIQCWSEANFTITDVEFYELEEQPIGNAYIALGANSKYMIAADTSEENEGKISLSDWEWGDDTETWGHYATIDRAAVNFTGEKQSKADDYADFTEKLDEGRTPTGLTLTGDNVFGFGYNGTDGEWHQTKLNDDDDGPATLVPTLNEETGKYELVITDICLTAPEEEQEAEEGEAEQEADAAEGEGGEEAAEPAFGCMFYDPNWGWGSKDVEEINVTWAFNYGEEEVIGSWNTFNSALADYTTQDDDGNDVVNAAHSVDVAPENAVVYLDREFEISVDFAQELAKIWYMAPTIVFNEAPDGDLNDLYEVSVRCEINDAEYEVDAAKPAEPNVDKEGNPVTIWNEGTGPYGSDVTGRTYGGCNEWAAKATYIGESAIGTDFVANNDGTYTGGEGPVNGVERVKYYITITEKEQPADESTPDSSTADNSTPESTTESTPEGGTNPGTGTAALATVGVALAAAAFVVSKKRK